MMFVVQEEEAEEARLREEIKSFDAALRKAKKQTMKSVAVEPWRAKDQVLSMEAQARMEAGGAANGAWPAGEKELC